MYIVLKPYTIYTKCYTFVYVLVFVCVLYVRACVCLRTCVCVCARSLLSVFYVYQNIYNICLVCKTICLEYLVFYINIVL